MIERTAAHSAPPPVLPDPEPPMKPQAPDHAAPMQLGRHSPEMAFNPSLNRIMHDNNVLPALKSVDLPDFADSIHGPEPQENHQVMAQLSHAVYGDVAPPEPWQVVDDQTLLDMGIDPDSLQDDATGFQAAIYTDGEGNYVLAFAGTDPSSTQDWIANLTQGAGQDSEQYDQAVQLAQALAAQLPPGALSITGHSLGGGLASIAALVTGAPAVTFNASGISDNTLTNHGLDPEQARQQAAEGLVVTYSVEGDILTDLQENHWLTSGWMPDAVGAHHVLADPSPDDPEGLVDDHNIGTVIDALAADRPWEE